MVRRSLVVAVAALVLGYLLGVTVVSGSLVSTTLGLRLLSVGPSGVTGIETMSSSGDSGVAFVTLLLALTTAYLGFETRRVAAETRRLAGTTQTEIDLLTKQTAALMRQADAQDAQLVEMRANAQAAAAPRLNWSITEVRDGAQGPEAQRTYLHLRATNLGAPAIMGDAQIDDPGRLDDQQSDKALASSGVYDVWVSFGPFPRGKPFEAFAMFTQRYRPLSTQTFSVSRAAISVAGRGEFFNDWSADILTADSDEALAAVSGLLERHRQAWRW